MSYIDVANSSAAQARIEDLMFTAAKTVLVEDPTTAQHSIRSMMANNILSGNTNKLVMQMTKFALTNDSIAAAMSTYLSTNTSKLSTDAFLDKTAVTDNDVTAEITSSWTTLANATYGTV